MHTRVGFSTKFSHIFLSPCANSLQNPRAVSPLAAGRNFPYHPLMNTISNPLKCRGTGTPVTVQRCRLLNALNGSAEGERIKSAGIKDIDVATLGNLCVDIVLDVPELPPESMAVRKAYIGELARSPPDKESWEAGGNCNVAIAASRLGLRTVTIGHVGDEIYGRFLLDVLDDQGIGMVEMSDLKDVDDDDTSCAAYETLLCWVFVDPLQRHSFCSRSDFREGPTFSWIQRLSMETKMAIRRSKIIFCNGFGFDELSPHLLESILEYAVEVGTSIFFDPGPRVKSLVTGTDEEQRAFYKYLRMCDVFVSTSEEAEMLTGLKDPILSGKELLRRATRTKWVIIKMGSTGSILISQSSISCAPSFKVNAIDTVGCGDSFVAAVAFGCIHEMPWIDTLTVANAVGAATAMSCGAGRNVAKLKQITELLRESNLNVDDAFWEERLKEHKDLNEITLLTQDDVDGNKNWLHRVSLQKAVSNLLPKLEQARDKEVQAC